MLRLEKMHIIVGQDTNAESNPLEAAMPWIVKLDKENDWIGRYAIEWYQRRGDRLTLVGWEAQNGAVPKEGTQVVGSAGEPAGRITSSRFSRRLGKAIGIAWVPVAQSEEGTADPHLRPGRVDDPGHRHPQGLLRPRWREVALVSTVADPFAFLSPAAASGDAVLRTPMERNHLAADAEIESHEGWRIAVYPDNGAVLTSATSLHRGRRRPCA